MSPDPRPSSASIALVDADSFYASCERAMDPSIGDAPAIVLSNNDGCVIAADRAAKSLGLKLGDPWFQIEAFVEKHGVLARSSNYELYGDMSARMMAVLRQYSAWVEVYSIDEAWVGLPAAPAGEQVEVARAIRGRIRRVLGLPVSVGIAPSKTLAKVASKAAKKRPYMEGVAHVGLLADDELTRVLDDLPVTDVWGIAARLGRRLAALDIHTAADLRAADPRDMRRRFSVVVERTVRELRGQACIGPDPTGPRTGQVIYSRSFSTPVTTAAQMEQVLAIYAGAVSRRLRRQGLAAGEVAAFAGTSWYAPEAVRHWATSTRRLPLRTHDPVEILTAARDLLPHLRPDTRYVRAGITLTNLADPDVDEPLELFVPPSRHRDLGALLDRVEHRYGPGHLGLGHGGLASPPPWTMKRGMLSPRATTHWRELAVATCK